VLFVRYTELAVLASLAALFIAAFFFSIDCRDALSIYCYQMLNDIIYRRYSTWFRYLFAKSVSG